MFETPRYDKIKSQMKEHPHEHTQYALPRDKDLIIDPNFTNVLKNTRDQVGSLNANIQNYSKSTSIQSNVIIGLTFAMLVLAIVQAVVAYWNFQSDQTLVDIRKQCYQSVLQTSDIDLNYKSCLRSQGLSN